LTRELDDIQTSLVTASGRLTDKANQDAAVVGIGTLLFWPALFALGGNSALEADVARLKGEEQAIKRRMSELDCDRPAGANSATVAPAVTPSTADALAAAPAIQN
jgi:hypothetical protein